MKKQPTYEVRIRYAQDYHDLGECYVFEGKMTDEDESLWSLDTAFQLLDYNGKKGSVIPYHALTKIRELMDMGIPFYFSKS